MHITQLRRLFSTGSERIKVSGVVGQELQEAIAINKSLLQLSIVFRALNEKQKHSSAGHVHVPYHDST